MHNSHRFRERIQPLTVESGIYLGATCKGVLKKTLLVLEAPMNGRGLFGEHVCIGAVAAWAGGFEGRSEGPPRDEIRGMGRGIAYVRSIRVFLRPSAAAHKKSPFHKRTENPSTARLSYRPPTEGLIGWPQFP